MATWLISLENLEEFRILPGNVTSSLIATLEQNQYLGQQINMVCGVE